MGRKTNSVEDLVKVSILPYENNFQIGESMRQEDRVALLLTLV